MEGGNGPPTVQTGKGVGGGEYEKRKYTKENPCLFLMTSWHRSLTRHLSSNCRLLTSADELVSTCLGGKF